VKPHLVRTYKVSRDPQFAAKVRRLLAERNSANQAAARAARAADRGGRRLDMRCRVARCKNMSRGPRFGYICDKHRSELSSKRQRDARQKWNVGHKTVA